MISESMQVKLKPSKGRSYETTIPTLTMPRHGGFSTGVNASASEEIKHFRLWNFIAISAIANKVSEYFPNVSIVSGQAPEPGRQYKQDRRNHAFRSYNAVLQAAMPEDITPAPDNHPLTALFRKVNSSDWWSVFVYEMIVFKRLTGVNYIWAIPNGAGKPAAMWNIPPQWVDPPDGLRNKQTGMVTGWRVVPDGDTSREITIPPEEMIAWRSTNPESKRLPLSPLRATAEWTDSQEAIEHARTMTFKNGPNPSALIETPDAGADNDWYLDDTFYRQAAEKFVQRYGGVHKSGMPLIAPPGYRYKPWSLTPKEMDFTESSAQVRDMILAAHGVPKLIAGITEEINRASALAALEVFCRETVQPILQDLAGLLTETLAVKFDPRLKVWFDDCVPRDNEAFRADVEMLFRTGSASPRWIASQYGIDLPEDEAYDQTYISLALVPVGSEPPPPTTPPPNPDDDEENEDDDESDSTEGSGEEDDGSDQAQGSNGSRSAAQSIGSNGSGIWLPERESLWTPATNGSPAILTSRAVLQQRRSGRLHTEFLRRQGAWEKRAGSELRKFWASLTEDVRQRLERSGEKPDVDKLLPASEFNEEFNRVMEPLWAAMAADGAKLELRALDVAGAASGAQGALPVGPVRLETLPDIFVGIDARAQKMIRNFLKQRSKGIWRLVSQTAKDAMRRAISGGIMAGDSIPQIRQRIIDKLNVSRNQATRIARTEATGSLNAGAQAVRDAEEVEQKIWMSTADDVTRTGVFDHVSPDGQIVANGDAFEVSREQLMYPGDANGSAGNICNCRCASTAYVEL